MKVYKSIDGTMMQTYNAIPFPIPEPWRGQLVALGKQRGEDPENDLPGLIRLEAKLRKMFGVRITRPVIPPVDKDA